MKKILTIISLALVLALTLSLAACNKQSGGGTSTQTSTQTSTATSTNTPSSTTTSTTNPTSTVAPTSTAAGAHKVTFDLNYEGSTPIVYDVDDGEYFEEDVADPTREGYSFVGWFDAKEGGEEADFERKITEDRTVYAQWNRSSATVNFLLNYEGAGVFYDTQTVAIGSSAVRPTAPTREGYMFVDWFTTADATTVYDFGAVTDDINVYASWEEMGEDTVTMTLAWGYEGAPDEGVYEAQEVNKGFKKTLPTPTREAGEYCTYKFNNWTDAEGTVYNAGAEFVVDEDATLTANWTVVNTFEAEYTDMSSFSGLGWSWTRNGTTAIMYDKSGTHYAQAGNDAFVGNMFMKGSQLFWEIEADKDVENVSLYFRLSVEPYFLDGIDFTSDLLYISVGSDPNDATTFYKVDFETFHINPIIGTDVGVFDNFLISTNISLKEGTNYVYLIIAQNFTESGHPEYAGAMGSMAAEAPVVDAMILEHEDGAVNLTWTPIVHNLWSYGYDPAEYPCGCPDEETHQKILKTL